ncbi:hypothetical protein BDV95DRAFT_600909 [Massariosphaeria phaeospora]|uniref:Uncharacterized protein n=1 Tax=Massariosphaeria phaeospora TaxID=100035 RepID=A0A7C8MGY5_9PLEO|nr:hypothetical protein BDV95DRAFT_600909 [Massariosphaeria phaeospora]
MPTPPIQEYVGKWGSAQYSGPSSGFPQDMDLSYEEEYRLEKHTGRNPRKSRADPRFSPYPPSSSSGRNRVGSLSRDEVRNRTDSHMEEVNFRSEVPSATPSPSEHITQANETDSRNKSKIAQQKEEINKLEDKLQASETEKQRHVEELHRATEEKRLISEQLLESRNAVNKLHGITVNMGLGSQGLSDQEVSLAFTKLRRDIWKLVRKHCTNENVSVPDARYALLTAEAKEFWVMRVVASTLYECCFSPEHAYFGFDLENEDALMVLHNKIRASNLVSQDDLLEWRVRACAIGKALDPQLIHRKKHAEELTQEVWSELEPFIPNAVYQHRQIPANVERSLLSICETALTLALMLNGARSEYLWAQESRFVLDPPNDIAVAGNVIDGYRSFAECAGSFVVVFGGVFRKLTDDLVQVAEPHVLLGPFLE